MKQNLVSLEFSAAQLEAVDAALALLEENLAELVTLTAEQRRKALKMGDGSEVFCRQTELVLRQNVGMVPADFELAELQQDIATLDALRAQQQLQLALPVRPVLPHGQAQRLLQQQRRLGPGRGQHRARARRHRPASIA